MTGYQVMPRLSADEYADLEKSIETDGVLVPIIVSPSGEIIDGHHRAEIAQSLGLPCPEVVKHGSPAELRTFAYSLNLHRRHLTREQKRDLIAQSLRQDPQLADREHARRTGVSPTTVGAVREELVESGDVSSLDTRTDSLGRQQPATKPPAPDAAGLSAHLAASDESYAEQAAAPELVEPSPAVTDWLDSSQAVKDSGYVRAYSKSFARAHDVLGFSAERLGPLLDQGEVESLEMFAVSVNRFVDTVRRSRTGLRVINGGQ